MENRTMGWVYGQKCNLTDPESGTVLFHNMKVISEPFLFHGNKKNEVAIMVKGIKGCVPLEYVTEPVKQLEMALAT